MSNKFLLTAVPLTVVQVLIIDGVYHYSISQSEIDEFTNMNDGRCNIIDNNQCIRHCGCALWINAVGLYYGAEYGKPFGNAMCRYSKTQNTEFNLLKRLLRVLLFIFYLCKNGSDILGMNGTVFVY